MTPGELLSDHLLNAETVLQRVRKWGSSVCSAQQTTGRGFVGQEAKVGCLVLRQSFPRLLGVELAGGR